MPLNPFGDFQIACSFRTFPVCISKKSHCRSELPSPALIRSVESLREESVILVVEAFCHEITYIDS